MTTTLLPPVAPPPPPDDVDALDAAPEVPADLVAYRRRYRRRLFWWSLVPVLLVLVVAVKLLSMPILAGVAQGQYERRNFDQVVAASDGLGPVNVLEPWVRHFDRGTGLAGIGVLVDSRTELERALALVPDSNVAATCRVQTDLALVVEQQGDSAVLDGDLDKASAFYTHALALIDQAPDGCFDDPDSDSAPPSKKPLDDAKSRLEQKQQQAQGQGQSGGSQGQGGDQQGDQGQGGGQGDQSKGDSGQGDDSGSGSGSGSDQGSGSGSGSDPLDKLQQQNGDAQEQQQRNNDRNRQFDQTPKDYTGKPW
ncbi:hypothetical protein EDF46_0636 [Frondihabitans sp. PhB188]|uniref:hypothetical protein n=1 Tax=Frondihabitans sp. PhB188 TaxID=2485200 RepID=UPI000F4AA610|nr:hypothetical protein [Frondihabitans sp. PhB188]ROQ41260.1 hypothetical protein EDF46_0636 [Frondihabitans sp. PhB188]